MHFFEHSRAAFFCATLLTAITGALATPAASQDRSWVEIQPDHPAGASLEYRSSMFMDGEFARFHLVFADPLVHDVLAAYSRRISDAELRQAAEQSGHWRVRDILDHCATVTETDDSYGYSVETERPATAEENDLCTYNKLFDLTDIEIDLVLFHTKPSFGALPILYNAQTSEYFDLARVTSGGNRPIEGVKRDSACYGTPEEMQNYLADRPGGRYLSCGSDGIRAAHYRSRMGLVDFLTFTGGLQNPDYDAFGIRFGAADPNSHHVVFVPHRNIADMINKVLQ